MSEKKIKSALAEVPEGSLPHAPLGGDLFLGETQMPKPISLKESLATIKNWFRANSLNVMAYGTGCGSIEMAPLSTARFDVERLGVTGGPTPRQSNVLVISGYLATKTLKRVIRSYEQMPSPKWVVGLGSCTINGGMYWDSYNTINQLDLYIPVDAYIMGCMPRPEALLKGFQELIVNIKKGEANGWHDYVERIDWYKENQKKVLPDWDMPDYNW
ncbi:NADH-quinone oxidoreductase subunit NuoB [Myxococcota bacterium]|nr:NADH-quinone oxidoreductase subunit NuoB [Myxococcota bacterium]